MTTSKQAPPGDDPLAEQRPFMDLISRAYAAEGQDVPTKIVKHRPNTEDLQIIEDTTEQTRPDRGKPAESAPAQSASAQSASPQAAPARKDATKLGEASPASDDDSQEVTSPGFVRGLMADPLSESLSFARLRRKPVALATTDELAEPEPAAASVGSIEESAVAVDEEDPSDELPVLEEDASDELPVLEEDASDELSVISAAGSDESLPVVVGAPADEAQEASIPELVPLDVVAARIEAALDEEPSAYETAEAARHLLPAWHTPDNTVVIDEETLHALHAQILATVEPLPGPPTQKDLPRIPTAALHVDNGRLTNTGSWKVTETSIVDASWDPAALLPAIVPQPPPVPGHAAREDESAEPLPFSLNKVVLERPTGHGTQGDLARKAFAIFEAAAEEFRAGRLHSAHTNAMLSRVYDPQCRVYEKAARWWGYLLEQQRKRPVSDSAHG